MHVCCLSAVTQHEQPSAVACNQVEPGANRELRKGVEPGSFLGEALNMWVAVPHPLSLQLMMSCADVLCRLPGDKDNRPMSDTMIAQQCFSAWFWFMRSCSATQHAGRGQKQECCAAVMVLAGYETTVRAQPVTCGYLLMRSSSGH